MIAFIGELALFWTRFHVLVIFQTQPPLTMPGMHGWLKVAEKEDDSVMELMLEEDGTLLLKNVRNVWHYATTLKYKNPATDSWRVVKCDEGVLYPPEEGDWGDHVYIAVIAKGYEEAMKMAQRKRAHEEDGDENEPKPNKTIYILFESGRDLAQADFKDYFSEFGTVLNVNGQIDRGFVFVTFDDEDVPFKLYGKPVTINGVEMDIKEPENDNKEFRKLALLYNENKLTVRQIREFFENWGEVTDVYVTKPFRKYGFITFREAKTARELYDKRISIEEVKVICSKPRPKMAKEDKMEYGGPGLHTQGRGSVLGAGPMPGFGAGGAGYGGGGFGANMGWGQGQGAAGGAGHFGGHMGGYGKPRKTNYY